LLFSDDDGWALLLHVWLSCSLVLKEKNCAFARNSFGLHGVCVWSGKWWGGTCRRWRAMRWAIGPWLTEQKRIHRNKNNKEHRSRQKHPSVIDLCVSDFLHCTLCFWVSLAVSPHDAIMLGFAAFFGGPLPRKSDILSEISIDSVNVVTHPALIKKNGQLLSRFVLIRLRNVVGPIRNAARNADQKQMAMTQLFQLHRGIH